MSTEGARAWLVEQYIDRLALDGRRRERMLASIALDLDDLLAWDRRLLAYGDALASLGPAAVRHARAALDEPLGPGRLFASARCAFLHTDRKLLAACLGLAQALPRLWPALSAAVEWSAPDAPLWPVLQDRAPVLYLQARSVHRLPLEAPTLLACLKADGDAPQGRVTLLQAIGFHGDRALTRHCRHYRHHPDPAVRLAAVQVILALAKAHHHPPALAVLRDLALGNDPLHPQAVATLAAWGGEPARALVEELAGQPTRRRRYVQALGHWGEIAAVPRLMECLDDPDLARPAGAALSQILGSDPVRHGWQADAPLKAPPTAAQGKLIPEDPDADLPWPDQRRFVRWWHTHRHRFDPRRRYLAGREANPQGLADVLRHGRLAWRPLAAWRLQCQVGGPRFPTHLPAHRQCALLPTHLAEIEHEGRSGD